MKPALQSSVKVPSEAYEKGRSAGSNMETPLRVTIVPSDCSDSISASKISSPEFRAGTAKSSRHVPRRDAPTAEARQRRSVMKYLTKWRLIPPQEIPSRGMSSPLTAEFNELAS